MKKYFVRSLAFIPLLCSMAAAQSEKWEAEPSKILSGISDGRITPPRPPIVLPEYEIQKTMVHHTRGQKITINQVVAPVLSPKPVKLPPTAQEIERANQELERILANYKPSGGFFSVGVTIYDHKISLLRFRYDGEDYEVFSNIDWNQFGGFMRFEGRGKQFTMMVFSGDVSTDSLKREIRNGYRISMPQFPKLPILEKAGASYMVVKGGEKNEVVMEFLEAVHDLYAQEKQILESAYQERLKNDVIRRARDEELRKNPPPKPDLTINFWKRDVEKEHREAAEAKQEGGKR